MRVISLRYLTLPLISSVFAACAASAPQQAGPAALPTATVPPTSPAALGATVAPMPEASQVPLGATVAPRPTATLLPMPQPQAALKRTMSVQTPPLEGEDVGALQKQLVQLGYAQVGQVDSVFGSQTERAVKAFQMLNGLDVDGVVGPKTWDRLFAPDATIYDLHLLVDMQYNYVVGASNQGKWLDAKSSAPYALEGSYITLGQDGAAKSFVGAAPKPHEGDPCGWIYEMAPADGSAPTSPFALGAAWDPMPRPATEVPTTTAELAAPVEATLKTLGLAQPVVNITRALRADVDGDGTQETVVAATYFAHGSAYPASSADTGDYSILAVIPAGAATATVVDSEVVKQPVEFGAVRMFTLRGLWDLNGDGALEILANDSYYEGVSTTVYALLPTGPKQVISEGCGV